MEDLLLVQIILVSSPAFLGDLWHNIMLAVQTTAAKEADIQERPTETVRVY